MKNQLTINPLDLSKEIRQKLITVRGQLVLIDRDVAALYGVETKALNQAVKRNAERFPQGYVWQLDEREFANWKSQIVTSNLSKDNQDDHRAQPRRPEDHARGDKDESAGFQHGVWQVTTSWS